MMAWGGASPRKHVYKTKKQSGTRKAAFRPQLSGTFWGSVSYQCLSRNLFWALERSGIFSS